VSDTLNGAQGTTFCWGPVTQSMATNFAPSVRTGPTPDSTVEVWEIAGRNDVVVSLNGDPIPSVLNAGGALPGSALRLVDLSFGPSA
jgi:hypothetical protein